MTSAPVKNAGPLPDYINTGNAVPSKTCGTDSNFGSAMNKATTGNRNLYETRPSAVTKSTGTANVTEMSKNTTDSRKIPDVNNTERSPETGSFEKQADEITKAADKMKNSIMETLDVSEEDLQKAMEILGFNMVSLLDPANLSQLVLTLSGEADPSSLLTNEALFQELQSLQQMAGELTRDLQQILSLTPEELTGAMADVQEWMQSVENVPADGTSGEESVNGNVNGEEKEQRMNVDIRVNGQEVSLETDGKGNVTGTVQMTKADSGDSGSATKQESGRQSSTGKDTGTNVVSDQAMLNNPLQNRTAVNETGFTQSTTAYTSNTQEIMDQILSNIRIRITPNVDSLEMQLHPQSLGTVHVQLTNHAGEITAMFHVQNEAVKTAVETQMIQLKEALNDQGVKVEAIEVSVDTRGFESSLWQGQENPGQEAYEQQRRTPRRINLASLDASFEEEATEEEVLAAKMMEANGNTVDFTA